MCEPSTQLNQSAVPIVTLLRLSWPAILEQLLLTAAVCFLLMGLFAAAGVGYSVQVAHALGGAGFVPCQNCGASSSQRGSADGDGGSCLHAPFVLVYSSVAGR